MKIDIVFLSLIIFMSTSFSDADYKKVFYEYKNCIVIYDDCISDYLLHGLVNMGGDSIKECIEERTQCNKKVEELIKEDK